MEKWAVRGDDTVSASSESARATSASSTAAAHCSSATRLHRARRRCPPSPTRRRRRRRSPRASGGPTSTPPSSSPYSAPPTNGRESPRLRSLQQRPTIARYEDFTECFAIWCEEQPENAPRIFTTVSRHMEDSITVSLSHRSARGCSLPYRKLASNYLSSTACARTSIAYTRS